MYRKSTEKCGARYFRPKSEEELVFCTLRTAPNDLCETGFASEPCLYPPLRVCSLHAPRSRQRSSPFSAASPISQLCCSLVVSVVVLCSFFLSVCLLSLSRSLAQPPFSFFPLFPSSLLSSLLHSRLPFLPFPTAHTTTSHILIRFVVRTFSQWFLRSLAAAERSPVMGTMGERD